MIPVLFARWTRGAGATRSTSRLLRRTSPTPPCMVMGLLFTMLTGAPAFAQPPMPDAATATPQAIAAALLDDGRPQQAREALARETARRAPEVVAALVSGLPEHDETEEYRRIPWIWRVAVAAGRQRLPAVKAMMDGSLPEQGQRLRDWQAVVLGGGVVMGLSQAGAWPRDEITPWLAEDKVRQMRWQQAVDLARAMADDAKVRNGTRYDALRMLAVRPWDEVGAQLVRYLSKEVDAELQMGAIGALGDLQDERAAEALLQHMPQYTERNRRLAMTALLRTDARRARLKAALTAGTVTADGLTPEQRTALGVP